MDFVILFLRFAAALSPSNTQACALDQKKQHVTLSSTHAMQQVQWTSAADWFQQLVLGLRCGCTKAPITGLVALMR